MPKILPFATILVAASTLIISSLQAAQDETTAAPAVERSVPDPIAVVNGEPIPRTIYEAYAQQRQAQIGDIDSPEARQALTEELVTQELLVQEAEEQNLDEDPQFTLQMEMIRRNLLATAILRKMLSEKAPDEAAVQKEYETTFMGQGSDKEYKARHILVDSKDKAEAVIDELKKGADFSELAESYSNDSSNATGGDLGWFSPSIMVPPFAEAVTKLEKGGYTEEPVETQFGWHVIMLDDIRDTAPPTLESMRPQLVQQLQSRLLNDYLIKLREDAEVELQ